MKMRLVMTGNKRRKRDEVRMRVGRDLLMLHSIEETTGRVVEGVKDCFSVLKNSDDHLKLLESIGEADRNHLTRSDSF